MKVVAIEELKKEYKKALVNNLIDKDRKIDLSEHAQIPSDYFNKFLDDLHLTDILSKMRIEMANLDNLNPNFLSSGIYTVDKTRVLQIIDKYINMEEKTLNDLMDEKDEPEKEQIEDNDYER